MSTWTETAEPEGEPLLRELTGTSRRRDPASRSAAAGCRISAMCTWGRLGRDCIPGDVRFMVIEFSVSPNIGFYVQILTEPDEVVLAEAVSPVGIPSCTAALDRRSAALCGPWLYRVGGAARTSRRSGPSGAP